MLGSSELPVSHVKLPPLLLQIIIGTPGRRNRKLGSQSTGLHNNVIYSFQDTLCCGTAAKYQETPNGIYEMSRSHYENGQYWT